VKPYQVAPQHPFVPYPIAPGDIAPNVCYAKISRILEGRMTSRDEMLQTIMLVYKAREEGNIEGLMAAFHPHAVFELKGDKSMLEVAGAVEGHTNVRAALSEFIKGFQFKKRDILDVIVEGDRAAVHSRLEVSFVPTNKSFTSDVLDTFRFEDGKIIKLVEFTDTALIKNVIAAPPSAG
jgi:ketosteroid isomerase-like protein